MGKSKEIRVGFIGLGNIGYAGLKHIDDCYRYRKSGYLPNPTLVYDIDKGKRQDVEKLLNLSPNFADSAQEIIDCPDIDIIVESTGKDNEAREIILESLKKGKGVVTPNKLVIAKYMREIFETARECNKPVAFESSVMASVPVISTLLDTTDQALSHLGILNGTTNYILTKMYGEKMGFQEALKQAQDMGFAEPKPEMDISGMDTASKNNILAALEHGIAPDYMTVTDELYREGIDEIKQSDLDFAKTQFHLTLKLLGKAKLKGGHLELGTYPLLISEDHGLAKVGENFNGLYINFKNRGTHLYVGKGAGSDPTKVPLVDDILRIAREIQLETVSIPELDNDIPILDPLSQEYPFFIRTNVRDKPNVLSKISGVLGDNGVSIDSVIQIGRKPENNETVSIYMRTHPAKTKDVMNALSYIEKTFTRPENEIVKGKPLSIRIENNN